MRDSSKIKVLVLGATGMLGSTVFRKLCLDPRFETFGTLRHPEKLKYFNESLHDQLISNVFIESDIEWKKVLASV